MKRTISAEKIRQYATASKDTADIHLTASGAAHAGYDRPIVHGMYIMGLAQSLYLSKHPGTWITACDMKFHKPLFVDSEAAFDYRDCDSSIRVTVTSESGETIASGMFSVKEVRSIE